MTVAGSDCPGACSAGAAAKGLSPPPDSPEACATAGAGDAPANGFSSGLIEATAAKGVA